MELLLWFSGTYVIYCICSLIGLGKSGRENDFYVDIMVTSAFGFFLLAGFSSNEEFTKESLGILAAIYGFLILIYGFLSCLIKAKNEWRKSE